MSDKLALPQNTKALINAQEDASTVPMDKMIAAVSQAQSMIQAVRKDVREEIKVFKEKLRTDIAADVRAAVGLNENTELHLMVEERFKEALYSYIDACVNKSGFDDHRHNLR